MTAPNRIAGRDLLAAATLPDKLVRDHPVGFGLDRRCGEVLERELPLVIGLREADLEQRPGGIVLWLLAELRAVDSPDVDVGQPEIFEIARDYLGLN